MFDIILGKDNTFESEELDKGSSVSIKETAEKEGGRNVQRKNFKSDN